MKKILGNQTRLALLLLVIELSRKWLHGGQLYRYRLCSYSRLKGLQPIILVECANVGKLSVELQTFAVVHCSKIIFFFGVITQRLVEN